ncbi:MAG: rhomboid family intramembrane serine protease [Lentisphaerae bacterium]|jgi:membrane associated rhomboid family serine protease|nr:rhomboid family intramembrane serine protease [Lentisphaerota bacterium]
MSYYSYQPSWERMLTPAVRNLLIINGVVFVLQLLLQSMAGAWFTLLFSLSWAGIRQFFLWQLVSYMFLHGGFMHLLLNMLGLFFFGPETERAIGTRRFSILYLGSGILGGLGWLLLTGLGSQAFCLGASGAVFGVLGAFAALFPERPITFLLFFIIPVTAKARTLAIGLGLFTLLAMIGQPGNIAYAAHLAGGLAGYGYILLIFNRRRAFFSWRPRQWLHDLRWRWQRRKFKVISGTATRDPEPAQEEVDAILAKISKWGLGQLTPREREILNQASRRRR